MQKTDGSEGRYWDELLREDHAEKAKKKGGYG